jgi:hypothetical protein
LEPLSVVTSNIPLTIVKIAGHGTKAPVDSERYTPSRRSLLLAIENLEENSLRLLLQNENSSRWFQVSKRIFIDKKKKSRLMRDFCGSYWSRTSDPLLVRQML